MENKLLNQSEPLVKERSYVKSIAAGFQLPIRHPWGFLRHLWPILVLGMIVWAALGLYTAHVLSDMALDTSSVENTTTAIQQMMLSKTMVLSIFFLLVSLIIPLFINSIFAGQVSYLMARYGELGYLPAVAPWKVWRDILPHTLRAFCLYLIGAIFVKLLLVGTAVLAHFIQLWALLPYIVIFILWILYYVQVSQQILVGQQKPKAAIVYPFHHMSHWGNIFAILLVCGIVVGILTMIGCIPGAVTFSVLCKSFEAIQQGDATDIPSCFNSIMALAFALGALIHYVAWLFMLVPLTYDWGSQHANNA